jgi:hypothetical protein
LSIRDKKGGEEAYSGKTAIRIARFVESLHAVLGSISVWQDIFQAAAIMTGDVVI